MTQKSQISAYAQMLSNMEQYGSARQSLNESTRPSPEVYNEIPDIIWLRVPEIKTLNSSGIREVIRIGNTLLSGQEYTLFECYLLEGPYGQPPEWAPGDSEPMQIQLFHKAINKSERIGLNAIRKLVNNASLVEGIMSDYDHLEAEYGSLGARELLDELLAEGLGDPRSFEQISYDAAKRLGDSKRNDATARDLKALRKHIDYVERAIDSNKDISEIIQLLKAATGRAEEIQSRTNVRNSGAQSLRQAGRMRGAIRAGQRVPDYDYDDINKMARDSIRKLRY